MNDAGCNLVFIGIKYNTNKKLKTLSDHHDTTRVILPLLKTSNGLLR